MYFQTFIFKAARSNFIKTEYFIGFISDVMLADCFQDVLKLKVLRLENIIPLIK
jgi:hypothetical protein